MMLQVKNLTAGYGKGPDVLHGVDLCIHENEIVTILGPNGAGKTTILKSIFGLTNVRKGNVFHGAREITGLPTDEIIGAGIAMVTQGKNIFPELTVEENLEMAAFTEREKSEIEKRKEEVFKIFPILKKFRAKKSSVLSGGERQMVAIGMGLMLSPEVLLLDEPSIGLAPKVLDEVFEKIQHVRDRGTAILMVEQNASRALAITDRAYVLELGKIGLEGTAKEMMANPRIAELYLGGGKK